MLSKKLQDGLNAQMNRELYSSYLYLSMAAYFEDADLPGFANWVYVQAKEELTHVERIFRYISDREGRIRLAKVEGPPTEWSSALEVFQEVFAHEQKVTAHIGELVNRAMEDRDHPTHNFLQWFVAEQVEEEASVKDVLRRIKMVDGAPGGLYLLDRELLQRVLSPPVAAA